MKIAIFTDSFLPSIGGTENAVCRFATVLSEEHEVMVFAPNGHKEIDDGAFPFKVARAKSIGVTKNDFWAHPNLSGKMKKALNDFKPDVVHSHTVGMMASFANKYAKKHDIPSISTIHTKFRYCYKDALKVSLFAEILLRYVMRRPKNADRVCTVSNSMITELKSYGLKRNDVIVIKNGNDEKANTVHKQVKDGVFKLLFVGRIIDYKNIRFSIDCLKELKKIRSDFVFNLVGRGPHIKKFTKYAKKCGLEENVKFLGAITDRVKLKEIYADSDLFFFTSIFDNDGLVVMEAAGEGTPSLVLKDTGASERITDGETGFLVEANAKAVADKISFLMDNRELLSTVGAKSSSIFTSWQEAVDAYVDIYKQEIEKKNCQKK
ncbi:MAG: glycosyltransferase [Clostridia bacterium]|nr:glycosyltransferase [Clostridia bacterium]